MSKKELSGKIEQVIDSLKTCKEYIEEDNSFEAEYWITHAIKVAREAKPFVSAWADKQEKDIGEKEQAKGYEVGGKEGGVE